MGTHTYSRLPNYTICEYSTLVVITPKLHLAQSKFVNDKMYGPNFSVWFSDVLTFMNQNVYAILDVKLTVTRKNTNDRDAKNIHR